MFWYNQEGLADGLESQKTPEWDARPGCEPSGADEGFQAMLTMNAKTGKGLIFMTNSDRGLFCGQFVLRTVAAEYKWNQTWGPQTLPELLLIAKTKGTTAALRRYTEVKAAGKDAGVGESTLNMLGSTLLQDGQTQDAITVFQRNVQEYPQSGNVYDSLGEAYLKAGQKDMAITNYEKSLQLDPKNQNAVEVLRKLKSDK